LRSVPGAFTNPLHVGLRSMGDRATWKCVGQDCWAVMLYVSAIAAAAFIWAMQRLA